MNSRELIIRFNELAKLYNVEVNLTTYEIYRVLTGIQNEYIYDYVIGKDQSSDKFRMLETLITTLLKIPYSEPSIVNGTGLIFKARINLSEITDFLYLISLGAKIHSVRYGDFSETVVHPNDAAKLRRKVKAATNYNTGYQQVKIVSQDSVPASFNNPFTGPSKRNPIAVREGNDIIMFTYDTFLVNDVDVKYIKQAAEVTDIQTLSVASEIHETIVDAAIKSLIPQSTT